MQNFIDKRLRKSKEKNKAYAVENSVCDEIECINREIIGANESLTSMIDKIKLFQIIWEEKIKSEEEEIENAQVRKNR